MAKIISVRHIFLNSLHGLFDKNEAIYCVKTSCSYHVSLLSAALLDPVELSERQLSGDGGGQRQLVVGTSSSLQFQT